MTILISPGLTVTKPLSVSFVSEFAKYVIPIRHDQSNLGKLC